MQVVWFKRDLRVHDHRPLAEAAAIGPVLPLYIVEPALWREADMAGRHWDFITEALMSLREDLATRGQPLVVRVGDVAEVLEELHANTPLSQLWSHEETGNDWTFRRDLKVAAWCRDAGIPWRELQNHGVQRRLKTRDGWAKSWDRFMSEPCADAPQLAPISVEIGTLPTAQSLGLAPDICAERQTGGRQAAYDCLSSFLEVRGQTYRRDMSSPLAGAKACSRLSPHLAWGSLSMRQAAQATWARQRALKAQTPAAPLWPGAMQSFSGRLHWHCHFIQKLEDQPRIEFQNLHSAYDGVRPSQPDKTLLEAWTKGETGLPFVDACMRSLRATGWLNFRMRAMVMATASYHLWLDWRAPGLALARMFTDYEPGIHWSQVQMQSGTTGINNIRIYNPVKQGYDQDPQGTFTRRWIPELAAIPDQHLQEPWRAENAGDIVGRTYPERIVDHVAAAKTARTRIWGVRGSSNFRNEANAIQKKHGSRKSGIPNRGQRSKAKPKAQMELPLGDKTS